MFSLTVFIHVSMPVLCWQPGSVAALLCLFVVAASRSAKDGRVAGKSATLPEKASSVDRAATKQSRSRIASTKSDVASRGNVAGKVPHNVSVSKVPKPPVEGTSRRRSRSAATQFTVHETLSSVLHWSPVCPHAVLEETSFDQTTQSSAPSEVDDTRPCESNPKEDDSAGNVPVNEAKILTPVVDENVSGAAGVEDESKPEVQQSSETPGRSRRACSMISPCITFASVRKTPKNLRNSLLLRRMSPEEGYVVYFSV